MSLACVRVRGADREFVGCGRGWEEPEAPKPVCGRCGRPARVTGTYSTVPIGEGRG